MSDEEQDPPSSTGAPSAGTGVVTAVDTEFVRLLAFKAATPHAWDVKQAEDAAQDVVLKVIKKLEASPQLLRDERNLHAFIDAAVTNWFLDTWEKEQTRKDAEAKIAIHLELLRPASDDPWAALLISELRGALNSAIAGLPRRLREVWCLRYLSKREYKFISKRLGLSKYTVGEYLTTANDKLRDALKHHRPESKRTVQS